AGLGPVVPAEQVLCPLEARLRGGEGRHAGAGRQEHAEAAKEDLPERSHGVLPRAATKMSSQLATWARKASSPLLEHVRSWFMRVCDSIRTSSRVSTSTT